MHKARVAKTPDGETVEVLHYIDNDGADRWITAHWFARPRETGQVGFGIKGPFASRDEAERVAGVEYGVADFDDVPDGIDPLTWADMPEQLREQLRRMMDGREDA